MRLKLTEILDYYDVPQLVVALDAVGTQYLCLAYDEDVAGRLKYIAANISHNRLNDLMTGHIDLRQIYLEPELALYDVLQDGKVVTANLREEAPAEYMLPDEGYYLNFSKRENHDMVRASQETGRTVIRLGYNYETNNHCLPWDVLTETLHDFQAIVSNGYRRVIQSKNAEPAQLNVRAALAASFDLELVANEPINLFGSSKVADTLDLLSPLFGNEDEAVANCLSTFRNTQKSYKNLLKTLSDRNVSFKCKWVQGSVEGEVKEFPVTKERIRSLYTLASNLEILEERQVTFVGTFFMANLRSGRWGMELADDGKRKYGICLGVDKLHGVVLHNKIYAVTCIEKPSQNPNTGSVYYAYIMTDIHEIDLESGGQGLLYK